MHEELGMKNCKVIPREACLPKKRSLWAEVVIRGRKKGLEDGSKEN